MRKIKLPKVKARHAAPGRARRAPAEQEHYRGTRRATEQAAQNYANGLHAAHATRTPPPVGRGRTAPTGRRLTPLSDRPNEMLTPRTRFAGADTAKARIDYELRQRDELRAQRATGGGKQDARIKGELRGKMGQHRPARVRFKGESTSAQLNATAKKLNPTAPTVRGTATRHSTALPGYKPVKHSKDPAPETHGSGFAGAFFGGRPTGGMFASKK